MGSEPVDIVIQRVGEKLRSPSQLFSSISRVPDFLRKLNEKAYEPKLVAIGPYHRYKDHLLAFEKYKISYLQTLINRTGRPYPDYVRAMWALEERARNCYGGSISFLDKDDFVQMMLFDGCFIVEVIRKFALVHLRGDDDPNFKLGWMLPSIARDMILLENQLPFFVLWELFIMTEMPNDPTNGRFLSMIPLFFYGILPGRVFPRDDVYRVDDYPINEIEHLLHLIHDIWLPSPAGMKAYEPRNSTVDSDRRFICSATKIQEAGIQFLKNETPRSLFDIVYENGVMKIPSLEIDDATEAILQNLIAYEQCSHDINLKHVTDYVQFLKCLINSSKDAELLCCRGIIVNSLGDDEVIAALLNKLCDGIVLDRQFSYSEIFYEVNSYCNRPLNLWTAKLRRWMAELRWRNEERQAWLRQNYFSTRWAIISFVGAVVLLLLTLLQALFAVLSYYQQAQSH